MSDIDIDDAEDNDGPDFLEATRNKEYEDFLAKEAERRGPRPEGMRIDLSSETEGPAEDPYGVEITEVTLLDGTRVSYRTGALTGKTLKVNGQQVQTDDPAAEFTARVGHTVEDVFFWAQEAAERSAEIQDAEMAASWDPNP